MRQPAGSRRRGFSHIGPMGEDREAAEPPAAVVPAPSRLMKKPGETAIIKIPKATRAAQTASGLIHSDDSQIDRSSSSSRHESRIVVNVARADRHRLEAIVSDRSAPQKHVWRAQHAGAIQNKQIG